ncbi:SDR family oxidoreductase [Prauserella alba]|uniref:SDR family oxidoreductase n=1 Tax=Prauserella alba TaxID=176898 RepID=A0ABP4G1G0_9PSEU|nr:SDR family oxidoreductase [Prauserella alba]MCP2178914.1 NAD(P)-dependent dehydrogenase, short-chain alcohol dehydrogenase family [Prauserella alba]
MSTLEGRTVVVTGAGRGLGLALAKAIGAAGAHLVVAERSPELAAEATAELTEDGIVTHRVDTDVADPDSVAELARRTADIGPVYGLVNNAALANGVGGKYFDEIPPEEWDRVLAVNVRGPWLVAAALYDQLAAQGGRIVNLSSDAAFYGSPRLAHYVTSKGAVVAMTRAMARDAGRHGVTVNAVAPGLTEGEATAAIPAERYELYRRNRALDRAQQPEDLTGLVTFLLSDAAAYITGQTMLVDGGFVCH